MGFELLRSLEIKEDLGQKGEENTYGQKFFSLNFTHADFAHSLGIEIWLYLGMEANYLHEICRKWFKLCRSTLTKLTRFLSMWRLVFFFQQVSYFLVECNMWCLYQRHIKYYSHPHATWEKLFCSFLLSQFFWCLRKFKLLRNILIN